VHTSFSASTLFVGRQEGHAACRKLNSEMLAWLSVWARCRFAYGPADATATHSSKSRLVLPSWFYLSGTGSPG